MADTRWNNYTSANGSNNQTWTAPEGITQATIEAWGSGGGGGSNNRTTAANAGGGGGGGAYGYNTVTVVGGTTYNLYVGVGGAGGGNNNNGTPGQNSWFNNGTAEVVRGAGGAAGNRNGANGAGGTTANSVGSTTWAGGRGNNKNGNNGGGGGGAGAARNAAGNNASSITGATGQNGGGNGGNGGGLQVSGNNGLDYGGGGGGAGTNGQTRTGGTGGTGAVLISWVGDFVKTLTETAGLTDTLRVPFTQTLTETASLTDTLTTPSKTLTDTATISHPTLKLIGIILMEAMSLADPAVTSKLTSRTLVETASLSDPAVITEKTGGPGAYDKTLTETLTLTDSPTKDVGRVWTESAGLADTASKGAGRALAEAATLTDTQTVATGRTKELTETLALTDSVNKGTGRVLEQFLWLLQQNLTPGGPFTTTGASVALSGYPPTVEVWANDLVLDPGNYGSFQLSWSSSGPWTSSIKFHSVVGSMLLVYVKGSPTGGGSDLQRISFIEVSDPSQLVEPYTQTVGLTGTGAFSRGVPVKWIRGSGVTVSDNTVTKAIGTSAYDAGASSSQMLLRGDGWVEFKNNNNSHAYMVGLNSDDPGYGYTEIDFAISKGTGTGPYEVYESGTYKASSPSNTAAGDFVRVEISGGVVQYKVNGVVFYTSETSPTYPLVVDSTIWSINSAITAWVSGFHLEVNSATLTDSLTTEHTGGSQNYTKELTEVSTLADTAVKGAGKQLADSILAMRGTAWEPNPSYYTFTDNSFTRSASNGVNGVARSVDPLAGDCWVQFTPNATNKATGVGLSNDAPASGDTYEVIDFFIQTGNDGIARVYENTSFRTSLGSYTASDVFKLQYRQRTGVVTYYKNGSPVYTSPSSPTSPLYVCGWAFDQNAGVGSIYWGASEQLSLSVGRSITDGVGLVDTAQKSRATSRVESATLTDVLTRGAEHVLPQSLGLTDVLSRGAQRTLVETAGLTDSKQHGSSRILTDGVGLTDTATKSRSLTLSESVGVADQARRDVGRTIAEQATLADQRIRSTGRQLTEGVGLVDTLSGKASQKTLTEGVGLTATPSKGEGRSLLEAAGLTGTLSLTQTQKQLSEQLNLSDVKETQHGGNSTKELSDPAQLTDTFSRQVSYQRTLTESSTLGDTTRKDEGRARTETATLFDSLLRGAGKQRTETLALSDTPRKDVGRALTEGLGLTGTVTESAAYPKQLTEISTLVDSLTRGAGKQRVETAALADTLQKATGILLGEGVGLSETIAFGPTRVNYEGLGLTEALTKGLGRTLSEGLAVADQTVTTQHTPYAGNNYTKTLTDALGLADSLTKGAGKQLAEATALLDSLTRQTGYARTLTEGAALLDSLQKEVGKVRSESLSLTASLTTTKAKVLAEVVGLTDLLTKQLSASRSLTETASLSDVLDTTADTKILTATANLSDEITKGLSRELFETASLLESFNTPKNLLEEAVLVDTFEFGFNRTKDFLQYVPLVDTLEVVYGLAGAAPEEQLVLDDSRSVELSRVLTETLGVRSTVLAPDGYGVEEWFTFAG